MNDIFLSCSITDSVRARTLVSALQANGLSVFWNLEVAAGADWSFTIRSALKDSRWVVVLWSSESIKSEWVRAEAQLAADQNKLIPVLIEPIEIPFGFQTIQHLDLTGWDGSGNDSHFRKLIISLRRENRLGREVEPEPDSPGDRVVPEPGREYVKLKKASKTNVFLAHASADKPKLRPIVMVLVDQGFRLWIDRPQAVDLPGSYEAKLVDNRIHFGDDWREAISGAVKKSDTVLSFWSRDAVEGRREQFHYEVYLAMMAKKLNQCRIDKVAIDAIGMPYTFDHIADLSDMQEGQYHPELAYLMEDMTKMSRSWWRIGF